MSYNARCKTSSRPERWSHPPLRDASHLTESRRSSTLYRGQYAHHVPADSAYTKAMSMVGLERDFIVDRVAAYVQQKWG
jgi:hypothetical protein